MNSKSTIRRVFSRKLLCIPFVLLIAVSFASGGVRAASCSGGTNCFSCAAPTPEHSHASKAKPAGTGSHGCWPAEQTSTCGFETVPRRDGMHALIPVVRSDNRELAGLFTIVANKYGPAHFFRKYITQLPDPQTGGSAPLYLLKLSLLR